MRTRVVIGSVVGALLVASCTDSTSATSPPADAGSDAPVCPSNATPAPGLVITDRGAVQGFQEKSGAWSYLGIPYAAPPVGALRWAAPAPHDCYTETFDATAYGALCVQVDYPHDSNTTTGSEDCLSLYVWAPSTATASSRLPVLFSLPGGGNETGGSADRWSDTGPRINEGADLAEKAKAIVVTINYRLGALGFLAHPALGAHPGNYGLLDQLAALAWVKTNIAAFGGDPSRVLLFGDSAGADDTCALVASPLGQGLFSAALMQSGRCDRVSALPDAQTLAQTFAKDVGCGTAADVAACMRTLDASTVILAMPTGAGNDLHRPFGPTVDGALLPDVPLAVIAAGKHRHVPFVIGSTAQETGGSLTSQYPHGLTKAEFDALVLGYFNGDQGLADQFKAVYPVVDYGDDYLAVAIASTTDAGAICPDRRVARALAKTQSEPVWRYVYAHQLEDNSDPHAPGAWHGQDQLFVFRHISFDGIYQPTQAEWGLADSIDGYWSRFGATGDPNGPGAVPWPRYETTADPYLQIDVTSVAGAGLRSKQCDFWDSLMKP